MKTGTQKENRVGYIKTKSLEKQKNNSTKLSKYMTVITSKILMLLLMK